LHLVGCSLESNNIERKRVQRYNSSGGGGGRGGGGAVAVAVAAAAAVSTTTATTTTTGVATGIRIPATYVEGLVNKICQPHSTTMLNAGRLYVRTDWRFGFLNHPLTITKKNIRQNALEMKINLNFIQRFSSYSALTS
jgi:hypothetical protein